MYQKKILFILISILWSAVYAAPSQNIELSDSASISLLTNSPSNSEVYTLFGHSAIRINDPSNNVDMVFNYGIFDFNSPNFMYRFCKGETDYIVVGYPFSQYILSYQSEEIDIKEQILNLTKVEKQNVFNSLLINALPENRVYRYNFFDDNCSTRIRDIIEQNIEGEIIYKDTNKDQSYRDLVHECVSVKPWIRFGIDLIIGIDADNKISDHEKQFIPSYLHDSYISALIQTDDGQIKPLILEEVQLLQNKKESVVDSNHYKSTIYITFTFFIITIIISYFGAIKHKRKLGLIYDVILFGIAGIAGSVIFYLIFFSEHPYTSPNWNLVWLNPLQLIAAILFPIKLLSKYVYYYHFINFVVLILLLLAWFLIPQHFEMAFMPLILSLCVRSGLNILQYKEN